MQYLVVVSKMWIEVKWSTEIPCLKKPSRNLAFFGDFWRFGQQTFSMVVTSWCWGSTWIICWEHLHFSSLDQESLQSLFPSDAHLTMRVLLAVTLVVVGSSMRMDVSNETQQLPKAGKGEKCSCYETPIARQDCCAAGLVCSKSRHICKPALGSPCKNHFVKEMFGISECSIGSYQKEDSKRKILCHPKSETESTCCVKKGSVLPAWIPEGKGSFSLCCTGRGYTHGKTVEGMQMWEMAEDINEHVCYEDWAAWTVWTDSRVTLVWKQSAIAAAGWWSNETTGDDLIERVNIEPEKLGYDRDRYIYI